jgi:hypothetical protein
MDMGGSVEGTDTSILIDTLKAKGGVIAYWDDLKVPSPGYVAAMDPHSDGMYHALGVLVIDNVDKGRLGTNYDRLYLLFKIKHPRRFQPSSGGGRWVTLNKPMLRWVGYYPAYDGENVCKWLPF